MDSVTLREFRKNEFERTLLWCCEHISKFDELTNPQDALVINKNIADLLQTLLDNELYQFALVAVYQCYHQMGTKEVDAAWHKMLGEVLDETRMKSFFEDIIKRMKEKPNERLESLE